MVALVLLVSTVVGAALVPTPYVAMRPGQVWPTSDHIEVHGAPSFPPTESVAFTTVKTGTATLLEALVGWLDPDTDVVPEELVRGDRSEEENRRYNAALMDESKQVATAVALEVLGEDVDVTTDGAIVRVIPEGTPAAEVLEQDDVIVAVDGEAIDEPGELGELLQPGGPGTEHVLTVERPPGSDQRVDVPITTIAAPDDPERAIIGVAGVQDRFVAFDLPIDVDIDSGDVRGPSAGLAFTLAVIDELTPGDLTGSARVAVTGTMSIDGTVGPVGGGAQKAVAVRDDGYDVFLVPPAELDEVEEAVGDALDVIAVRTIDEALEALAAYDGNAGEIVARGATRSKGVRAEGPGRS